MLLLSVVQAYLVYNHDLVVNVYSEVIRLNDEIVLRVGVGRQRHLLWSARVRLVFLNFLQTGKLEGTIVLRETKDAYPENVVHPLTAF